MKLDNENDRQILLDLIGKATIQGSAVFVIADLVQRIQSGELDETRASGEKAIGQKVHG